MDAIQAVRELGKAIQEDERYISTQRQRRRTTRIQSFRTSSASSTLSARTPLWVQQAEEEQDKEKLRS
ncbi:MAG: hypothetical protein ACLSG5_04320 [Oscillospiraceae bacterium]